MKKLLKEIDKRLHIGGLLKLLFASFPQDHIPILEAPPFSLGRIAALLFGFLVVSGLGLTLFYEPTAIGAASSLAFLHAERPLGWLIHNTHRWSALLFLAVVILHALRVLISRAYRFPRDINWWLGISMLILVIFMGGTGYILRWDVKAFSLMSLVISNLSGVPILGPFLIKVILGGSQLDVVPLQRGYILHVWFLPFLMFAILSSHLLVAWRQGLAEVPKLWLTWIAKFPIMRRLDMLPGIALLILVILLSALTPHEGLAGPTDRSVLPHPDMLLMFYFLPFWLFGGTARVIGTLILPAVLLILLLLVPKIGHKGAKRLRLLKLSAFAIVGVIILFGQISVMNYEIPIQGCNACHRAAIIGGAPMELSEFKLRDPDWLVQHLRDPLLSIFEPAEEPSNLP